MAGLTIRAERAADRAGIHDVTKAAFGKEREARMVEAIRASDGFVPEFSLVAELDGAIIHVMLSYVGLERSSRLPGEVFMAVPHASYDETVRGRVVWPPAFAGA